MLLISCIDPICLFPSEEKQSDPVHGRARTHLLRDSPLVDPQEHQRHPSIDPRPLQVPLLPSPILLEPRALLLASEKLEDTFSAVVSPAEEGELSVRGVDEGFAGFQDDELGQRVGEVLAEQGGVVSVEGEAVQGRSWRGIRPVSTAACRRGGIAEGGRSQR